MGKGLQTLSTLATVFGGDGSVESVARLQKRDRVMVIGLPEGTREQVVGLLREIFPERSDDDSFQGELSFKIDVVSADEAVARLQGHFKDMICTIIAGAEVLASNPEIMERVRDPEEKLQVVPVIVINEEHEKPVELDEVDAVLSPPLSLEVLQAGLKSGSKHRMGIERNYGEKALNPFLDYALGKIKLVTTALETMKEVDAKDLDASGDEPEETLGEYEAIMGEIENGVDRIIEYLESLKKPGATLVEFSHEINNPKSYVKSGLDELRRYLKPDSGLLAIVNEAIQNLAILENLIKAFELSLRGDYSWLRVSRKIEAEKAA